MGTCFKELRICQKIEKARQSKAMLVVVVYIALFLDYILLTVVVPIIPSFLYEKHQVESIASTSPELPSIPPSVFSHPNRKDFALEGNTTVAEVETRGFEWSNSTGVAIPDVLSTQCTRNDSYLDEENVRFGLLLASKAIVQLVVNPFIGPLTNRVGYHIPMLVGLLIIFVSTIMYAFSNTYIQLFLARALQGIGSSCSSVAGLGMLASNYTDDDERGRAIGIALGGVALGVLIGAPFGSVMYEFAGKSSPFLILAALSLLNGGLQLWILQPTRPEPESQKGSSLFTLLRDPYILIATGSLIFANMAVAMLEQALPLWMMKTMCSSKLQLGLAFLPSTIAYLLGTSFFGVLATKIGRWLCSLIGMVILGISIILVPFATSIFVLIAPSFGAGLSLGMIDASMFPTMGHLVDIRHVSVYGSVFAIADVALCLGFAIGPSLGGVIVKTIGFQWLMVIIGAINVCYSPLCFILRNPPVNEEKMMILNQDYTANCYTSEKFSQDIPMTGANNTEAGGTK